MQGEEFNIQANGVEIHGVRMGQGEPLLLLHGHPETCLMWHKVAPQLAERFTVVATDLRGYGDSGKPEGLPDHSNYSKRTMAEDQIEVMRALGFERFHVMGHDRGARVAYRMALDHPEAVNKLVLLDIVSTYDMYSLSTREFAKALFQWYFFTQEAPAGGHDPVQPEAVFRYSPAHCPVSLGERHLSRGISQDVYDEYLRHYNVETIHAICEEYRAGRRWIWRWTRRICGPGGRSGPRPWCCGGKRTGGAVLPPPWSAGPNLRPHSGTQPALRPFYP